MNTNARLELLKELKLQGMARSYDAILQLPVNQHPVGHQLIAALVEAERQNRTQHKRQLFLKLGKLRYAGTLQQISFGPQRTLAQDQIHQLADCRYVHGAVTLCTGAPT